MEWYARSLEQCSPWGYLILAGQVLLIAQLVERFVFLFFRGRINDQAFLAQIRKLVLAGNPERAVKLCQALGSVPVGRVCLQGLAALDSGPFGLKEELDKAVAEQLPQIRRRLGTIPLIAVALALIGVLGSKLLGAGAFSLGGDGPLPLGLSLEYAPGLLGVASAVVGLLGWLMLSSTARKIVAGLERCRQELLDLAGQRRG